MPIRSIKTWLIVAGLILSLLMGYFALHSLRTSYPVAAGTLRGMALSMADAIEVLAVKDPSFNLMNGFTSADIAYFAILDKTGKLLFHTNPDLIGYPMDDNRYRDIFENGGFKEARIRLGTGEEIYELNTPIHLGKQTLVLRLALHSFKADSIIRQARIGNAILFALLALGWLLGWLLYRYASRLELQSQEMIRHEHMAKLGALGAVLAHEVRNPLAGIKGYAQLLKERLPDGDEQSFARLIEYESVRLEGLVTNLLALTKEEAPAVSPINLRPVMDHAIDLMKRELYEQGIRCTVDIPASCMLMADRDRLLQVILNLVQNAIQAMPDGGALEITATLDGEMVEIRFGDTGVGISMDDQERIFEPFFTSKARGSGLGLAICRKYLDEMHGTIGVASMPGDGTTFRVAIPSAKEF